MLRGHYLLATSEVLLSAGPDEPMTADSDGSLLVGSDQATFGFDDQDDLLLAVFLPAPLAAGVASCTRGVSLL